jgi:ATP-binding cassette subfamily B protein
MIIAANLIEGAFRFLMRRILIGTSRLIEFDLRNDLFGHLQKLSARFYQRQSTGDLMARATNDLSAVRSVLGPGIMYSLNTVFTTVFTVSLLVTIDPGLAGLTLIPLVLVSLSVKYFGKRIHDRFEKIQEQFSKLTTLAQENLSGIRVVKAYSQENAFVRLFSDANREYMQRSLHLVRIQGVYNPLLVLLLGISSLGVLWYGGRLVIAGTITLGDLVAFMAYLVMLTWPTIALGWVINVVERGSASMGRINKILEEQPEIPDNRDPQPPPEEQDGHLEVRNLTFSYNGTEVLQGVSFSIQAGKVLAIVGRTGSGKSTLANLICHLYPVPQGTIFFGGRDLNEIPPSHLRSQIGYVPQDTFLFSETIRDNISLGRFDSSFEDVKDAARKSNILEDIEGFPNTFQTQVGERGITLSGGQKQRIAISRALLTDPRLLILDDALSAVDTYTEEQILQGLSGETRGKTVILISHRISTIKNADQVLVMDQGKIVERGTHESLLESGGQYAQLYRRQLIREELGIE